MSPVYWALSRLHRFWMRVTIPSGFLPSLPLVVVGALRSGGSGKTSVTLELAKALRAHGCRPAILAYRLGPGRKDPPGPRAPKGSHALMEVFEEDDWRLSSEEAVLLRRESGCRVFATRDRAAAWRRLQDEEIQSQGAFDILLSDDGFQDPRLEGAFRLLLTAPGERPGLFDLLPGGPFRETDAARARADLVLEGPYPGAWVTLVLPGKDRDPVPASGAGRSSAPAVHRFHRALLPPPEIAEGRPWIAYCALGDNAPFLGDLAAAGIRPVLVVEGRNHAAPPLELLRSCLAWHPGAGILCTRKDHLKLGPMGAGLPLFPVGQGMSLDPETVAAIAGYRLLFRNRYLVHYPGC